MDEISRLRLHADFVVLSACETGLGQEVPGEGIVGLARAFLHAGSRAVVVSSWPVSDASTAVLMDEMYRHGAAGVSLAEALRRARGGLRVESSTQHPFFWAPFVVYGD
jgi:CHAT domain-containing protein